MNCCSLTVSLQHYATTKQKALMTLSVHKTNLIKGCVEVSLEFPPAPLYAYDNNI